MIFVQQQKTLSVLSESHASLEVLKITEESFQSIQEEEKEITWNGKRYDIKKISHREDGIVELVVKHDTLETNLKNLVSILQGGESHSTQAITHAGFLAFFFQAEQSYALIQPLCPSQILLHSSFDLSTCFETIIAPPPRA